MVQTAMMGKLPYSALRDAVFTHPTMAEGRGPLFGGVRVRKQAWLSRRFGYLKRNGRQEREFVSLSQECNQRFHGLLGTLFHEPMPGVFQVDRGDGGRHKINLRGPKNCGASFFASDGYRMGIVNFVLAICVKSFAVSGQAAK